MARRNVSTIDTSYMYIYGRPHTRSFAATLYAYTRALQQFRDAPKLMRVPPQKPPLRR